MADFRGYDNFSMAAINSKKGKEGMGLRRIDKGKLTEITHEIMVSISSKGGWCYVDENAQFTLTPE